MKRLPILPPMQCDPGCGDCCGPVIVTEVEYQAVRSFAQKRSLLPVKQGLTCPFYQGGTCTVYEVRPFACQLFGHIEELPCSRGYNVNISSEVGGKAAMRNGRPTRMLHELLLEHNPMLTLEGVLR
jgi:hypothetical protein